MSSPDPTGILIVEDNVDAAEALAMLLRLSGHDVRIAGSGASAIAAVEEWTPEVFLVDIGLPDMDGRELVRRLRANERIRRACMVAVSGYGQPSDIEESLEAGFDHHLVKPVNYDSLDMILANCRPQR